MTAFFSNVGFVIMATIMMVFLLVILVVGAALVLVGAAVVIAAIIQGAWLGIPVGLAVAGIGVAMIHDVVADEADD